jgi:hypothetical protein
MLRKLVAALSPTQLLFIGSSFFPYLQKLVVPRSSAGWPAFFDLLALLLLIAAPAQVLSEEQGLSSPF